MKQSVNIKLARILAPREAEGACVRIYAFDFNVAVKIEDGVTCAIYAPLDGSVVGTGRNAKEAVEDFAQSFMILVDHYINWRAKI